MWSDFVVFCIAVVSHWQSYATGGVVTGVISVVERLCDRKMPKWAYAAIFLGAFLLVSFFLAWRDEYHDAQQVPALRSQLREREAQIQQLKDKPPLVQVTIPPTIVNIPAQMAYIGSTDIGIVISAYRIGGNFAVSADCKNVSPSVVAENAACVRGLRVVDTELNAQNQPIAPRAAQDKTYRQFLKDISSMAIERRPYGPQEGFFGTVFSPKIDKQLDNAFRSGSKTILYAGYYNWRDGVGTHTNEVCAWLQIYPGMFSGPGVLAPNASITWNHCPDHDGLKQ